MKSKIFIPISFEEKKEKIKEITQEFVKKWIFETENDKIYIWHFLDFISLKLPNEEDMRKEKKIVLEVYYYWMFLWRSLDNQPSCIVNIIYNLFLKIKKWKQDKKK